MSVREVKAEENGLKKKLQAIKTSDMSATTSLNAFQQMVSSCSGAILTSVFGKFWKRDTDI